MFDRRSTFLEKESIEKKRLGKIMEIISLGEKNRYIKEVVLVERLLLYIVFMALDVFYPFLPLIEAGSVGTGSLNWLYVISYINLT